MSGQPATTTLYYRIASDVLPTYPSQTGVAGCCTDSKHQQRRVPSLVFSLLRVLREVAPLSATTETRLFPNVLQEEHTTLAREPTLGVICHADISRVKE